MVIQKIINRYNRGVKVSAVFRYKVQLPTFRAPRTHKETASFALSSTCDFAVRSSVNAVSCNALDVKASMLIATTCTAHSTPRAYNVVGYYNLIRKWHKNDNLITKQRSGLSEYNVKGIICDWDVWIMLVCLCIMPHYFAVCLGKCLGIFRIYFIIFVAFIERVYCYLTS